MLKIRKILCLPLAQFHYFIAPGGPGIRIDSHIYTSYASSALL